MQIGVCKFQSTKQFTIIKKQCYYEFEMTSNLIQIGLKRAMWVFKGKYNVNKKENRILGWMIQYS